MNSEFCGVVNRHFPDGERYIRVLMDVSNQDVVVVQNTFPDKKIVELLLILEAVKEAGAKSITCVIPYMGYSRQERVFQAGEARSAKAIASAIGAMCDRVFTINVHTPSILDFFGCEAKDINGSREVVRYLKGFKPNMVVAPDEGSKDRCTLAADMLKVSKGVRWVSTSRDHWVSRVGVAGGLGAVSYTHLTLPTNREV